MIGGGQRNGSSGWMSVVKSSVGVVRPLPHLRVARYHRHQTDAVWAIAVIDLPDWQSQGRLRYAGRPADV